eukprot:3553729-Pleurochrysis_carterae.AAC.1
MQSTKAKMIAAIAVAHGSHTNLNFSRALPGGLYTYHETEQWAASKTRADACHLKRKPVSRPVTRAKESRRVRVTQAAAAAVAAANGAAFA